MNTRPPNPESTGKQLPREISVEEVKRIEALNKQTLSFQNLSENIPIQLLATSSIPATSATIARGTTITITQVRTYKKKNKYQGHTLIQCVVHNSIGAPQRTVATIDLNMNEDFLRYAEIASKLEYGKHGNLDE